MIINIQVCILIHCSVDFVLDRGNILLNATNTTMCLTLSLSTENSGIGSQFIKLTWTDNQIFYDVYFPSDRQNATITIVDDCKLDNITILASSH